MGEKQTKNVNPMEFMAPATTEFYIPSGAICKIREQTGADEETLSRVSQNQEAGKLDKFLSGIILGINGKAVSADYCKKMKSRDRNYILLQSRIFSLGSTLLFDYEFSNGNKVTFEEDLNIFTHDYSDTEFPKESKAPYPYTNGAEQEVVFNLSSGQSCKFNYLTGLGEQKALELNKNKLININSGLVVRDFQIQDETGNWHYIENFNMFTSRFMAEIRKQVKEKDPDFELLIEVTDPSTGLKEELSLFSLNDFFFPGAQ